VHRKLKQEELDVILGDYKNQVAIVNHDPDDTSNLVSIGKTSFNNEIRINRLFYEADFKIVISDTEYHQFCGYGGGAKSVFPGLADRKSIEINHSRCSTPGSEKGKWKDNPVRQEIEEAGEMSKVDFLINVVLNLRNKIVKIFSGDLKEAFLEGVATVNSMNKRYIEEPVDLVLASPGGFPRDIDLYQSQKALETASKIVEQMGHIVILAECRDGYGSALFRDTVANATSIEELITNHKKKFILGAHKAYQFARELENAHVYLYSSLKADAVRKLYLQPVSLTHIRKLIQSANKIAVLPYAASTHVVLKNNEN
jgi:nickel-dependent lactate racemase